MKRLSNRMKLDMSLFDSWKMEVMFAKKVDVDQCQFHHVWNTQSY